MQIQSYPTPQLWIPRTSLPAPDYFFAENFGGPYSGFDNAGVWTNIGANPNVSGVPGMAGKCLRNFAIDYDDSLDYSQVYLNRTLPDKTFGYFRGRFDSGSALVLTFDCAVYAGRQMNCTYMLSAGGVGLYRTFNPGPSNYVVNALPILHSTTFHVWFGIECSETADDCAIWAMLSLDGVRPSKSGGWYTIMSSHPYPFKGLFRMEAHAAWPPTRELLVYGYLDRLLFSSTDGIPSNP